MKTRKIKVEIEMDAILTETKENFNIMLDPIKFFSEPVKVHVVSFPLPKKGGLKSNKKQVKK